VLDRQSVAEKPQVGGLSAQLGRDGVGPLDLVLARDDLLADEAADGGQDGREVLRIDTGHQWVAPSRCPCSVRIRNLPNDR
jgi:hypothetical protein